MNIEAILDIISFFGIVAFSVSGAMVAIKKRVDLFGVIFLAVVTAIGGGITRDIFLDRLPPVAFIDTGYMAVAAFSAVIVYIIAKGNQEYYQKNTAVLDSTTNVFDALGLSIFVVMGSQATIDCGYSENAFLVVFIGVLTGIGGGFLRDIMVREIPFVLKKHFYALAAVAGALVYYILYEIKVPYAFSVLCSASVTFLLRMLATKYKWNLPPAF